MTVRPLLYFPHPRLREQAQAVVSFDEDLALLVEDLTDTMRAAPGIGITAPHIGVLLRVVVLQLASHEPARAYINPVILGSTGPLRSNTEGSISMPGVHEEVERPDEITFQYQDLAGKTHTETATGLLSVCMQHEVDQLDGIFWIQRLSRLKRERVVKRYDKVKRASA
jgi:peptide deformylase